MDQVMDLDQNWLNMAQVEQAQVEYLEEGQDVVAMAQLDLKLQSTGNPMELYLGQEQEPALQEQEQGLDLGFQRMEPPLAAVQGQQPDPVEEDLKTQEAHQLRQQKVMVLTL